MYQPDPGGRGLSGRPDHQRQRGAGDPLPPHGHRHGTPGGGLAGEPVRPAQHRPSARHGGYRRAGRGAQRGHGDGEPRAVRVQAGGLAPAFQE